MNQTSLLVDRWIRGLQPNLEQGADGSWALTYGADLDLILEVSDDGDTLVWYVLLDPLPPEPSVRLLTWALGHNLHQVHTQGGCLAWDAANGQLIFSYRCPLDGMNEWLFGNCLANVLETAITLRQAWRDQVQIDGGSDPHLKSAEPKPRSGLPEWALQA